MAGGQDRGKQGKDEYAKGGRSFPEPTTHFNVFLSCMGRPIHPGIKAYRESSGKRWGEQLLGLASPPTRCAGARRQSRIEPPLQQKEEPPQARTARSRAPAELRQLSGLAAGAQGLRRRRPRPARCRESPSVRPITGVCSLPEGEGFLLFT